LKTLLVLSTVPNARTARRISDVLVREKLAACVSSLLGITSVYSWKGKIEKSSEVLLLIKTTSVRYPALQKRIIQLHPYSVPEIVALPITKGAPTYLNWLKISTFCHPPRS